jgi:hypothetical protein
MNCCFPFLPCCYKSYISGDPEAEYQAANKYSAEDLARGILYGEYLTKEKEAADFLESAVTAGHQGAIALNKKVEACLKKHYEWERKEQEQQTQKQWERQQKTYAQLDKEKDQKMAKEKFYEQHPEAKLLEERNRLLREQNRILKERL